MRKCLFGTLLLVSLGMIQILAQEGDTAQEEKAIVSMASPQVLSGERAYLTLLLANAPNVSVAQLDHWVELPKNKLQYVSSRLGIAADLAKAVLDVEVQDQPVSETGEEETVVLHLSIKSERPIPDGPLVEVSFTVANVQPQTIIFAHRLEALDPEGHPISDIIFSNGQLEVTQKLPEAPPGIFSCFFYMH